jgi:hypothetical protein
MEFAEQRPGAAARQQLGVVADIGLEHRPHPFPVRGDEAVMVIRHLGRYLGQYPLRPLEQVGRAVRPPAATEHAPQARPDLIVRCRAEAS